MRWTPLLIAASLAGPCAATVVEHRILAADTPASLAVGRQIAPGTVVSEVGGAVSPPYAQRFILQARAVSAPGEPSRGVARWIGTIGLADASGGPGDSALGTPGTSGNRVLPPMNSGFALQGTLSADGRLISGVRAVYPFFQSTVWRWDEAAGAPLMPVPQLIGVAPAWTDVKEFTLTVSGGPARSITLTADLDGPASAVADPYRLNQNPPETPEPGSEPQTVAWIADPSAPDADFNAVATLAVEIECGADFNGAGGVTVQDIYDFLSAWNAGAAAADFNGEDGVSVQDIYDFLQSWSAGCG